MENQSQNNQASIGGVEGKYKKKFALIIIINIIVTVIVTILAVFIMQAGLRSDINELQNKVQYIKLGK